MSRNVEINIGRGNNSEPKLPEGVGFAIFHKSEEELFENFNDGFVSPIESESDCFISMPEFKEARKRFFETANKGEENFELYCNESMALAGVISFDEVKSIEDDTDSGKQAIKKAVREAYPNLKLYFGMENIEINGIPTTVSTDAMKKSYEGLSELVSHEEAVKTVTSIMKGKLEPLFGVGENERNTKDKE